MLAVLASPELISKAPPAEEQGCAVASPIVEPPSDPPEKSRGNRRSLQNAGFALCFNYNIPEAIGSSKNNGSVDR
jgi:hypothetical protein